MTAEVRGDATVDWLFCENDTNVRRLFGSEGAGPFKDGFNDYIVEGDAKAVSRTSGGKLVCRSASNSATCS